MYTPSGYTGSIFSWTNLQAFTSGSEQDRLHAGWIGAVFAPAAEIMRLYKGWPPNEIGALQAMFKRAFYPPLNTASRWNGNVDLTQIDAILAERPALLDRSIHRREHIEQIEKSIGAQRR